MPYVSVAHIKDRTWSPISYHLSSPSLPKLQRQTSAPCTQRAVNNSKPSLKRSTSRGYRTTLCSATRPPSPRSHPSPKTVRFKGSDGELESVCLFRARGRPSSIPTGLLSDTETESEWDSTAADSASPISPIPSPFTAPESNVHLESVSLLPAWHPAPPLLRGVVRVRNISYQKQVVARFTTDNWTMTNCESQAQYVSATSGDDNDDSCDWDRFAFTISLGGEHSQFANAPESCTSTLLLAVRYTVPGVGEWWDNNGGDNFRVVIGPPQGARHRARLSDHVGRLAL
ncbi:putative phosphatase regulatory subunit-domain-containing protein [Lactifluus volemus]|nr:putative phosphatase regulatory subunit-domain-containing protein [Lactifluus volemus]